MTPRRLPFHAAALAALLATLVPAPPAAAQGVPSFTLQVPQKATPLTRVKVVVTLASDSPVAFELTPPDGDSQRIPSEAGMLSPGSPQPDTVEFCTGSDCSALPGTVARDLAWVVPPPGGLPAGDPGRLRYEIWLNLLSNFDPNDFCSDTMPVAIENWTLAVDAGPNLTGACPLSFDADCPGSECTGGCLNMPALAVLPAASIPGAGTGIGQACGQERPALDVVLALDKSGSMSGSTLGGGTTKIVALRNAVTEMVDMWEALRTAEGTGAPAGDQVGIVFFDGNAHEMDGVGVGAWAGLTGLGSFDGRKDTIRTNISGVSAGGSTSMGDGLLLASSSLFAGAHAGNGHRKVVLLMSNGLENTDARVKVDNPANPTQVQTYPTGNPANTTPLPNQASLQVYAVTVGTSTAVSADVNEDIATATGGFYVNSEDDADRLGSFFLEMLQNFAKFNTYEVARLASGTVAPGAPATVRFFTSGSTGKVAVSLRTGQRRVPLRLTLTPPDGQPVSQVTSGGSLVMSPTLPLPPPKGLWTAEVEILDPVIERLDEVPFRLTVLADDHALRTEMAAVPADYAPGDPIRLRARVLRSGRPATGLGTEPGTRLLAQVVRPGESLGELLSASTAPTTQPQPGDPLSPAGAKLANELQANPEALRRESGEIVLVDDGSAASGDETAGDGVYSALFTPELPGHYDFLFTAEAEDVDAGSFTRQHLQTVHVRSVPDPDRTEVSTTVLDGSLAVTFTPRTRFGHRMGPGFGPFFWVVPRGAEDPAAAAVAVTDRLDGTYRAEVPFTGDPPEVDIHFVRTSTNLDEEVRPENLPQPLGGGTVLVPGAGGFGPGGPGGGSRWSLSLHLGTVDPQDGFPAGCGGDTSLGVDVEYLLSSRLAVELFYGQDELGCVDFDHLALNAKWYFGGATLRPFAGLGPAAYDASPGDSELGFNLFGGLQWNVTPRFAAEAMAKYHWGDPGSGDAEWLAYTAGLRVRF